MTLAYQAACLEDLSSCCCCCSAPQIAAHLARTLACCRLGRTVHVTAGFLVASSATSFPRRPTWLGTQLSRTWRPCAAQDGDGEPGFCFFFPFFFIHVRTVCEPNLNYTSYLHTHSYFAYFSFSLISLFRNEKTWNWDWKIIITSIIFWSEDSSASIFLSLPLNTDLTHFFLNILFGSVFFLWQPLETLLFYFYFFFGAQELDFSDTPQLNHSIAAYHRNVLNFVTVR